MDELYILPFDHRGSFMKDILKASSPPTAAEIARARAYKKMIFEAFKLSTTKGVDKKKAGILVDEWLGRDVLIAAKKAGFITATPFEKSGQDEFDFEYTDFRKKIAEFDVTYIKALVRYNPEGDAEMNKRQMLRLAELSKFLRSQNRKFLFELLVPATKEQLAAAGSQEAYDQKARPALMVKAIRQIYAGNVNPDIWKIEGLDSTAEMERVATAVVVGNKNSRVIILGRGESAEKAEHWLKMGAKVNAAIGFAVGRTVFKEALQDYAAGKASRKEAIQKICDNYTFFVNTWKKVKGKKY